MRKLSILLVSFSMGLAAFGQTNSSATVREVSLQDCIQMALEHNLGLQIARYEPQLALYSLKAAYGAYDPTLSLSGQAYS